jgi:acetyl esterase/lipase
MKLWDDELEAAREVIRRERDEFLAGVPRMPVPSEVDAGWVEARRAAQSAMVLRSEKGADRTIAGPAGPLRLREFRPSRPAGVMLHIHGGGWMTGEPELTDLLHEALADDLNLAIVSVEYRRSPEHPFPAGPDDCEAAALWLVESARSEYATDRLLIGGESAGAHLSALTLLRLRDRHGLAGRFCGANLVFGAFDLGRTPSARGVGAAAATDLIAADEIALMLDLFLPGMKDEDRRSPEVSPLYAPLHGMPPALFTVGTADHLLDDSLLMAARWQLAGNPAELLVYPDAPHGCMAVPTVMNHWWPRLQAFLGRCLASG